MTLSHLPSLMVHLRRWASNQIQSKLTLSMEQRMKHSNLHIHQAKLKIMISSKHAHLALVVFMHCHDHLELLESQKETKFIKFKSFTTLAVLCQSINEFSGTHLCVIASRQHSSFQRNVTAVAKCWQHSV